MKENLIFVVITLVCCVSFTNSYKFLVMFPVPGKSHYFLGNSLAKGLVKAGHDVTMVSPFEEKNPPPGGTYTNVVLQGAETTVQSGKVNFFDLEAMSEAANIYYAHFLGNLITNYTFSHENFKKLIRSKEKFDVVIIEQFCDDAIKVLGWYYDIPIVMFSTIGANYWVNPSVGNPSPLAYIPDVHLSYTSNMSFWQRCVNTAILLFHFVNKYFYYLPIQDKILHEHFPGSPHMTNIINNVSLVLLNSHESLNQPLPLVPNMISVGGMHIMPGTGLPDDLKIIMDKASEGIVYFSMGSNIKPSEMKEEIKKAIFNSLKSLPYKILMKWDEDIPDIPKNIYLKKWFPQQDVLAHPHVKLFITHGGLLSTLETIHYGVPILALPVFGDQKMNAAKAELAGYALNIPFSQLTEEVFSSALDKLLNDPKYSNNAKRRQSLMLDRPVKPMDLAVYWLEFIARHKGASHLRVEGVDMPFYKYFLLDVIAAAVTAVSAMFIMLYILIRKVCCSRSRSSIKKLKKH